MSPASTAHLIKNDRRRAPSLVREGSPAASVTDEGWAAGFFTFFGEAARPDLALEFGCSLQTAPETILPCFTAKGLEREKCMPIPERAGPAGQMELVREKIQQRQGSPPSVERFIF
jgi:hypothetical protein